MIEFHKTALTFDPVDRFLNVIPIFHIKFNARKDLFYKLSEIPPMGKKIATKNRQKPPGQKPPIGGISKSLQNKSFQALNSVWKFGITFKNRSTGSKVRVV